MAKAVADKEKAEALVCSKEKEVLAHKKAMNDFAVEIVDLKNEIQMRDKTLEEYTDRINTVEPELRQARARITALEEENVTTSSVVTAMQESQEASQRLVKWLFTEGIDGVSFLSLC